MKVIKQIIIFIVITVLLTIGCNKVGSKKENDQTKKDTKVNYIKNKDNNDVVSIENFKDNIKSFHLFDETYNSFKKTILIQDVFYTAVILPKDYYIINNLKQKDSLSFYKKKMKNEEVFQFDLQHVNNKDLLKLKASNYEEYIKYMASGIKKDFYAVTSKGDTIKPKGVFFERTFTLTPYKRVLLYFNFPYEIESEIKLVYSDELFQNGILKFLLKK